jgi:uncharacterized protein YqeY
MSKISEIKAAQLAARKAKDAFTATVLTTIIGEAEMVGKSLANRESTDAEVVTVLKKFEKNQLENVKLFTERGISTEDALKEIAIIRQFLPKKLDDVQVKKDIEDLLISENLLKEQKSLGPITKLLKQHYKDQFAGQQVSNIFKGML